MAFPTANYCTFAHRADGFERWSESPRQTDPHGSWIVPVVDRHIASLVVFREGVEEIGKIGIVDDRPLVREVFRPNGHVGAIVRGRPCRMCIQYAAIGALGDDK